MKRDTSEEYLGKYEVVFGQHLDAADPQLSPKVKELLKQKSKIEQIFGIEGSPKNTAKGKEEPPTEDFPAPTAS